MKKHTELSIIGILLISSVYSLIITQITNYVVGTNFYIGLIAIMLVCLLRIKTVRLSNYLLGITLFLGTFNLIAFSHSEYGFTFSIAGSVNFTFNPIVIILLLIYGIVNGSELNKLLGEATQPTEEEKRVQFEEEIESFKNRFSSKSRIELQEIIENAAKSQTVLNYFITSQEQQF